MPRMQSAIPLGFDGSQPVRVGSDCGKLILVDPPKNQSDTAMSKLIRLLQNLLGITGVDSNPTEPRHGQARFTAVWDVDGVVVVRFHDLNAAVLRMDNMDRIEIVSGELLSVADPNPLAVILDFEERDFVPVAAFECILVRLHKKLDDKLRMCNLPVTVAEHFEINQLATLFQVYTGLEDALDSVRIPHLELPKFRRIPLIADRLLVGRIPYDEEKHRNVLAIAKEEARCEGEWLYLPDPHVSKRHAILTRTDDGKYAIEDTESTSGTFVNDQAITGTMILEVGDTIKMGELNIVYNDDITRGLNFLWQRFDGD